MKWYVTPRVKYTFVWRLLKKFHGTDIQSGQWREISTPACNWISIANKLTSEEYLSPSSKFPKYKKGGGLNRAHNCRGILYQRHFHPHKFWIVLRCFIISLEAGFRLIRARICKLFKEPRSRCDNPIWRTGPPGYIGWRNSFLGIDSWAP
jgi:hypothetical protein